MAAIELEIISAAADTLFKRLSPPPVASVTVSVEAVSAVVEAGAEEEGRKKEGVAETPGEEGAHGLCHRAWIADQKQRFYDISNSLFRVGRGHLEEDAALLHDLLGYVV